MKIPRVVWRYTNPNSEDPREGQFFDSEEHFEVFPAELARNYNRLADVLEALETYTSGLYERAWKDVTEKGEQEGT
jgi:hypothetical protein